MDSTYWHKQDTARLFPDIAWSRPENRQLAGKLLIVGGNTHGFASVAEAYSAAVAAGAGTTHVLLPDSLKKVVGPVLEHADFAPSTPSGSFSKKALSELLSHAAWADAVLLAGDMGRNSETAIMLEAFVAKFSGALCITKDTAEYFTTAPQAIKERPRTLFTLSLAQLQRLAQSLRSTKPVTFDMGIIQLTDWLRHFSTEHPITILVHHGGSFFVAHNGLVSTTKSNLASDEVWRVPTAAKATVWWLQNPEKPFESITTSLFSAEPKT